MYCQVCCDKDRTYKNFIDCGSSDDRRRVGCEIFATTFLFAMADRTHNGLIAEQQVVAMEDVKIFVHERWHERNEEVMYRIGTWDLFQEGLTWNCHSQCLRTRSKGRRVEILIIEPDALYNGPVQDGKQQFDNRSVLDR
jgi:hypothetical protein